MLYVMSRNNNICLSIIGLVVVLLISSLAYGPKNTDPRKTKLITTDIDNFWLAFDSSKPIFEPSILKEQYLAIGSKGVKGFMNGRIQNADYLAKVILAHKNYYASIRESTNQISSMENMIIGYLINLKEIYPEAIFPDVYFVIGALNSGGTTSRNGLIISAEMYGLTPNMPKEELSNWLSTVLKPVDQIPHIVAHEVVHFQQNYKSKNLLSASIKESSADFIAELISGEHINHHVHEFANPKEEELWLEFKERMLEKDFSGWLYSSQKGRPSDLGYWIGY